MNFATATHIIYLPTGEVARIVELQPNGVATVRCEFADGRQEELWRLRCMVQVTPAAIAEYQRKRCLLQSLAGLKLPARPRSEPPPR